MKAYVTDTHALLWHLLQSKRLSKRVASIFRATDEGNGQIYIPNIVLVEKERNKHLDADKGH